jgi:cytochrome P450
MSDPATDPQHDPLTPTDEQLLADPWRGWNSFDPQVGRDRMYERIAALRRLDPVNETPLGLWRLTRYDDVVRLLKHVPSGVRTTDGKSYAPHLDDGQVDGAGSFMLTQDPPAHTRLRKLVSRAFTPRRIDQARGDIQRIVDSCLDKAAETGHMDVIADLALPLPATVICRMLGVPVEDQALFTEWTGAATHALTPNPSVDPTTLEKADAAALNLRAYFSDLIKQRRKHLNEELNDDLLSSLIRVEEEGDRLSAVELVSQTVGLLIAGFETTIGLIGNGVRALIVHPAELAKLRANPALGDSAVDECLRWDGPIPATLRILHEDAEFGGKTIPKNAIVLGILAGANRDPEVFPDPDRFDIERTPNEHLAFGGGVHFCLGAHLAKLEGKIALTSLLTRFQDIELESDTVVWGPSIFRVPGTLPIRFRAEVASK